jgi:GNAT superfamily N-acetyltransferase
MDGLPVRMLQSIPGLTYQLDVPHLTAIQSEVVPNPYANLVGAAKLRPDNADAVIQQLMAWYDGAPFGWVWSHTDTPKDLPDRLTAHGLQRVNGMKNMVLDHFDLAIDAVPGIEVRQAGSDELDRAAPLLAEAYGMGLSADGFRVLCRGLTNSFVFLTWADGEVNPIGFAMLSRVHPEVVLLSGTTVHEAWRGRGIYKATLAERLRFAQTLGATLAVIQAVEDTSAPIVSRLGFRAVGESAPYVGNME